MSVLDLLTPLVYPLVDSVNDVCVVNFIIHPAELELFFPELELIRLSEQISIYQTRILVGP